MFTDKVGQVIPLSEWRKLVLKMPSVFPVLSVSQSVDVSRVLDQAGQAEPIPGLGPCFPAVLQAVGAVLQEVAWANVCYEPDGQGTPHTEQVESPAVGAVVFVQDGVGQVCLPHAAQQTVVEITTLLREEVAHLKDHDCAYLADVHQALAQLGGWGTRETLLQALPRRGQDLFAPLVSVVDTSPDGGEHAVLALWPYQLAKIAVGPVRVEPFSEADGTLAPRPTVTLSMTYDHRVLTQTGAVHLLARVRACLEQSPPPQALPAERAVCAPPRPAGERPQTQLSFLTDLTQALALGQELHAAASQAGEPRLAHWAILVKAVATAALAYPNIASKRVTDGIAYLDDLTISLLVDGPEGLCVWTVNDPTEKTVEELVLTLAAERERWLAGETQVVPERATLLVTDLDPWDMDVSACPLYRNAVVNLAFGPVREAIVWTEGRLTRQPQAIMNCVVDHALLDAPTMAGLVAAVREILTHAQEKRETFWERRPLTRTAPEFVPISDLTGWRQLWMEWIPRVPEESVFCLVDMSEAVELYRRAKEIVAREAGVRLTYTAIFLQALGRALVDHPLMNAGYEEVGEGQVRLFPSIVLGVNVDAGEKGQPPFPIHGAEHLTLVEIARALNDGIQQVRAMSLEFYKYLAAILRSTKQIQPDISSFADLEMTEQVELWEQLLLDPEGQVLSQNTVNVASFGLFGTVINYWGYVDSMDCLTSSFARIMDKPVYENGTLKPRPYMWVSTFYDLRVVDVDRAARFQARLCEILENALTTLPIK